MANMCGIFIGIVAAIYVFLRMLLNSTQDRGEPRALATSLPFISPVIGMSREKTNFHIRLR
jgi:hypothetical protein